MAREAIKLLVLAGVIALLGATASRDFFGRNPAIGGIAVVAVVGMIFALFPEMLFLRTPSAEEGGEGSLYRRRQGARWLGVLLLVASFAVFIYMIRIEQ